MIFLFSNYDYKKIMKTIKKKKKKMNQFIVLSCFKVDFCLSFFRRIYLDGKLIGGEVLYDLLLIVIFLEKSWLRWR